MITELKSGDKVCQCILLRLQKIGQTSNGGFFARGTAQDKSGMLNFISFSEQVVEMLRNNATPCAVIAYGLVQPDRYASNGAVQLLLERVELTSEASDLICIMPVSAKDLNHYQGLLDGIINNIVKPHVRQLLSNIFSEDVLKRFISNPAAMVHHHAYIGGLLEHSVEVATLAKSIASGINDIDVDTDITIAGALLHDIGKIEEISCSIGFDYTTTGRLLGHIAIGAMLIEKAISKIEDFPSSEAEELLHIILSHHGSVEKGSPVACLTPESFIVHYADEINATLNQFAFRDSADKGEWQYNKMLSRQIKIKRA